jgi:predicted transposase YdaD
MNGLKRFVKYANKMGGLDEYKQEWVQKGRQEGRLEGRQEGRQEALELLKKGYSLEEAEKQLQFA